METEQINAKSLENLRKETIVEVIKSGSFKKALETLALFHKMLTEDENMLESMQVYLDKVQIALQEIEGKIN